MFIYCSIFLQYLQKTDKIKNKIKNTLYYDVAVIKKKIFNNYGKKWKFEMMSSSLVDRIRCLS